MTDAVYLTRKQAAAYLTSIGRRISTATLANYARNGNSGDGPPYHLVRWTRAQYLQSELDAWAARPKERKRVE